MTLLECLQTFITANETLAAKVPGGVIPQILPRAREVSCMVVRLISGVSQPSTHDSGLSPWSSIRMEFTVYGPSYKNGEQAILLLINMFSGGYRNYLGGSPNGFFSAEGVHGPRTIYDQETQLTGVQVDILGLLNRSTLS